MRRSFERSLVFSEAVSVYRELDFSTQFVYQATCTHTNRRRTRVIIGSMNMGYDNSIFLMKYWIIVQWLSMVDEQSDACNKNQGENLKNSRDGESFPGGWIFIVFQENIKIKQWLSIRLLFSSELIKTELQTYFVFSTFPGLVDHCFRGYNPQPPMIFIPITIRTGLSWL